MHFTCVTNFKIIKGEKLNAALSPAEKTSDFKGKLVFERSNKHDSLYFTLDRKRSSISPVGNTNKDQKSFIKAVISRKSLPFVRGALEELQRIFRTFGYIDVCMWMEPPSYNI